MAKCIYCDQTDTNFNDEHIIPQFFGGFEPLNPILKKQDGLVCKECNSKTFSALETIMKEDSEEGLFAQQLNLEGSGSVRILGKRLTIKSVQGFGDSFFNEMFPFLKIENDKIVVDMKRQVKVRNYADGYQIFPVDTLKNIKNNGGKKFEKVKKRISNVKGSDITIFSGGDSHGSNDLDEIISLLKDFGVKYNEKERKFEPADKFQNKQLEVNLQCTVDRDIGRVLAKIVFNYFTYCALQDKQIKVVYGDEFKKIRDFIKGDVNIPLKDIIISIDNDCILDIEKQKGQRLITNIIVFKAENEKIVAKLTLFGKRVYEIIIGEIPEGLDREELGCGHAFDPFDRTIKNLTQKPKENPTEEDIRVTFGLYKRVRESKTDLKKRKQDLGIFYTPESVVDFIYDVLKVFKGKEDNEKSRWESRKPKSHFPSVIDPACGEGIFLKKAIQSGFTGHHPTFKVPYIFGVDLDESVVNKWAELSILSLFEGEKEAMQKHFYGQNGLLNLPDHKLPYKKGEDGLFQFDAVVGNPPYGGIGIDFKGTLSPENQKLLECLEKYEIFSYRKNKKDKAPESDDQMGMFIDDSSGQKAHISRNEIIKLAQGTPIEVLFIERFIQLAKTGGWIAIIIPDGILANSNMHYVRQFIADKTKVLGIVSLPRNTFKHVGTSAKTSILFLQKHGKKSNNDLDYPVFLASINALEKSYFDQIVQSFNNFHNNGTI